MIKKELKFTNDSGPLTLESKCYELCDIRLISGGSVEGFKLNVVSYIAPVKSDVPIVFSGLSGITFLNEERSVAEYNVKLNFTDKSQIQLILTPPEEVTEFELYIGYYEL